MVDIVSWVEQLKSLSWRFKCLITAFEVQAQSDRPPPGVKVRTLMHFWQEIYHSNTKKLLFKNALSNAFEPATSHTALTLFALNYSATVKSLILNFFLAILHGSC